MKVSLNWIKNFTNVKLSDDQIIERIGSRLAEVDSVEKLEEKYEGILVAEITDAREHPDADKLGVYKVNYGRGTTQVVAGDKTLNSGDKVAYIPPGTVVPKTFGTDEPFKIKKTDLRGETSNGMLASASELDWGDDHEGVLKLDTDAKAGKSLIEAYELDDVIIEVDNKSLTNRPDCFGVIGFAREVAGIQEIRFTSPEWWHKVTDVSSSGELKVTVDNQVSDLVPTYLAVAIKGIEIKPSPQIMQTYLSRIGLRPINNIVDVTNYLMVMTGQPLHAFDYDKVKDGGLVIRKAKKNEELQILDGRTLKLDGDEILIADSEKALAMGGVMGGNGSEVTDETINILLECANFDMYKTRSTSMRHGIFTDAVTRFARGQSPDLCKVVVPVAVEEFLKVAGGEVASEVSGSSSSVKKKSIKADVQKINNLLGTELSPTDSVRLLYNVEVEATNKDGQLNVQIPFWRNDLNIWEDISEEVGRLSGYDHILATLPRKSVKPARTNSLQSTKSQIRNILTAAGANELLNYSGISSKLAGSMDWQTDGLYKIKNSRSPELEYMRPALIGSLLSKIRPNHKRGHTKIALFEVNPVHNSKEVEGGLPIEIQSLAFVYSSTEDSDGAPFYEAKNYLTHLLDHLGINDYSFDAPSKNSDNEYLNSVFVSSRSASVVVSGQEVGVVGEFNPTVESALKLPENTSGFEVRLDQIVQSDRATSIYKMINKFPVVQRDVTYEMADKTTFGELASEIEKYLDSKEDILYKLRAKDIYRGENTGRRATFGVDFWNINKTLTSEEVNGLIEGLAEKLGSTLGASQI